MIKLRSPFYVVHFVFMYSDIVHVTSLQFSLNIESATARKATENIVHNPSSFNLNRDVVSI